MVFTPSAVARRPPFLVVSLINPEWLAWKPLVFVLERARTVNFVGSGLLRNMADLGTRVVLRSSCLSFRSFAFRFFPCSPSPTANACVAIRLALRLAFLRQRFFISDPVFFYLRRSIKMQTLFICRRHSTKCKRNTVKFVRDVQLSHAVTHDIIICEIYCSPTTYILHKRKNTKRQVLVSRNVRNNGR